MDDIVTFAERHVDGFVTLCAAEGTDEAVPFYESFRHRRKPGGRIYA